MICDARKCMLTSRCLLAICISLNNLHGINLASDENDSAGEMGEFDVSHYGNYAGQKNEASLSNIGAHGKM